MKMISRGSCGAVLGLCLLSMVRGAGADDDWYQRQWDDWWKQRDQTQREAEQAERDRQFWQAHRDYHQNLWDSIELAKRQNDEILNKVYDDHPWARAGWTAGAEWSAGGWKLPESEAPAGRSRFRVSPQPLVILNPFVSQAKERQNEEQVSEQVTRFYPQMILNPFVRSAP
jgi:hypothetical protein